MRKMNFWVPSAPFQSIFAWQITPDRLSNIGAHMWWERLTELFLSNSMNYGKSDIEWQTSIQGMSLSDLRDYLRKR